MPGPGCYSLLTCLNLLAKFQNPEPLYPDILIFVVDQLLSD